MRRLKTILGCISCPFVHHTHWFWCDFRFGANSFSSHSMSILCVFVSVHNIPSRTTNPIICRFLIARSCEDVCCRKRTIAKKSATSEFNNYMGNYRQCEITNSTYNSNVNNLRIKSLVQIFSTNGKKFVCLGSLVHPKAVLTTLECVST